MYREISRKYWWKYLHYSNQQMLQIRVFLSWEPIAKHLWILQSMCDIRLHSPHSACCSCFRHSASTTQLPQFLPLYPFSPHVPASPCFQLFPAVVGNQHYLCSKRHSLHNGIFFNHVSFPSKMSQFRILLVKMCLQNFSQIYALNMPLLTKR